METCDFAIIGAGIAGASLAWRLAAEASVLVLEAEDQPGRHATGRSAAMFMESYGPPGVRALTRASRPFYEQPPAGFTDHPLLAPRGALYVATHAQAAMLDSVRSALEASGSHVEALGAAQTLERAPCLRAAQVAGALYERDAQDIDVSTLHQGFLRGLRAQGGRVRTQAGLRSARFAQGAWTLSCADGGTVRARTLVNAAGAWVDEVARLCGVAPLGFVPRRRSAFTFRPPEGLAVAAWPAVVGIDESWYFKPDAGQLLGSPANADDTHPHDVMPEELDIALGIHRIEEATMLTIRRPTATWAGLRTFAPDGEIVIGFDTAHPAFFWLAGQGGYGIQSAAGASELAAALVQGRPAPAHLRAHGVDAQAVSPARRSLAR